MYTLFYTWMAMLLAGNLGHTELGFWTFLPLGLILAALSPEVGGMKVP